MAATHRRGLLRGIAAGLSLAIAAALLLLLLAESPGMAPVSPEPLPAPEERAADAPAVVPEAAADERLPTTPAWLERALDLGEPTDTPEDVEGYPVRGRLAWRHTGVGIAGATVSLTRRRLDTVVPIDPPRSKTDYDPGTETRTDATGYFTLPNVPPRENLFLRFDHEGLVDVHELRRWPSPFEVVWQGEYLVEPRGAIEGLVVTPDGRPVGGARVRAIDDPAFDDPRVPAAVREARLEGAEHVALDGLEIGRPVSAALRFRDALLPFPETRTRGDGTFRLDGVREGIVRLAVQADRTFGGAADVAVVAGRTTDVGAVQLGGGVPFTVTVTDPDGDPIAGVAVAAGPPAWRFWPEPTATDAAGTASFLLPELAVPEDRLTLWRRALHSGDLERALAIAQRIERKRGYAVLVQRGRGRPFESVGRFDPPSATVVLAPPAPVTVHLVSIDGRPVPRARLRTRPHLVGFGATETEPGVWRIRGWLPNARIALIVTAPGFVPVGLWHLAGEQSVPMEPIVPATVEVFDWSGTPVEGARVAVAVPDALVPDGWLTLGRTDARGATPVEVGHGGLVLRATHPDYAETTLELDEGLAAGQRVRLSTSRFAILKGVVVQDTRPVDRRLRVRARHLPWGRFDPVYETRVVTSSDAGRFAFPRLPAARWSIEVLEAEAPEFERSEAPASEEPLGSGEFLVAAGEERYIEVFLGAEQARLVRAGRVLVGGAALARLEVELHTRPSPRSARRRFVESREHLTFTDADGFFTLEPSLELLGRNSVVVSIQEHGRWRRIAEHEFSYEGRVGDLEEPLEIAIPCGRAVLGLFDAEGGRLANRMIELRHESGSEPTIAVADASGTVTVEALQPGKYRVAPVGDRSLGFHVPFTVLAGETVVRDLIALPNDERSRSR